MSSSVAPLFPKTSVFIPAYWESARGGALTQEQADALYLKFPTGQGTESIPNLIVSGTSTLGITSASTLSLSNTTDNALTIGNQTTETGNMNFGTQNIKRKTGTASTNQQLNIYSINTKQTDIFGQLQLLSGSNTLPSRAQLYAQQDVLNYSYCDVAMANVNLYHYNSDGEVNYTAGIKTTADPAQRPQPMIYFLEEAPSSTYTAMRIIYNSIEMFSGSLMDSQTNIASFTTDHMTFYKPLLFNNNAGTGAGVQEISTIGAATGTTTMTTATAFQTIISTPSTSGRIFVLPAPTAGRIGWWYKICNKSTAQTIAIQYPSGTTIFTIPVSPTGGAGSVGMFAVDVNGTAYFRAG